MGKADILADTNIILYAMEEHPALRGLLRCAPLISMVSEIELLGKPFIALQEQEKIQLLLADITILPITNKVKNATIRLKQLFHLKMPDAIIAATAQCHGLTLLTADKDFEKLKGFVEVVIVDL
ncbi:MAG: type II toxin-antitoxin system VapC family toxin [Prevotellaceae bacterium]|jgi:predicted nucleic acid-binding protein|nr:type II toxin-antitoxin system VapC family toxin [Prevotellaceae bacterium]